MSLQIDLAALTGKLEEIYSAPKILFSLIEAVHNPDADTATVEHLIKFDTAFSAKILSQANSAFYGYESKISNIHTAIVLLGFKTILNMAVNICAYGVFHSNFNHKNMTGEELWKHSVGVSICAKHLSGHFKVRGAEDFITLGMLHDIGLLVEAQFFPDAFTTIFTLLSPDPGFRSFFKLEDEIFGHDHAFLSQFFCSHWRLPKSVTEPLLYHHDFQKAPENIKMKSCLLNLADIIVSESRFGFCFPFNDHLLENILSYLQITEKDYAILKEAFQAETQGFDKNTLKL